MKVSVITTAVFLLACVTCNYGQVDKQKGLALMKKAMACFGNVDVSKIMQMKGGNPQIEKLMKGFQTCKSQPMDKIGLNSTVTNCLNGVVKSISMR
uniref:Putative secreted protein synganglion overexpressed n=1 Tax=Rhipicephalus microplus TaxID=6941 RepID=A0A6M2DCI3_RHIMP